MFLRELKMFTVEKLFNLLPAELSKDVISRFLFVRDVVRLDTAFGTNCNQKALHELIIGVPIADEKIYREHDLRCLLGWKVKRGILIDILHCGFRRTQVGNVDKNPLPIADWMQEYIPPIAHNILELFLKLQSFPTSLINAIAEHCGQLRKIHVLSEGTKVRPSIAPITQHCQALKMIVSSGCLFDHAAAVNVTANLEELHVFYYNNCDLHTVLSRCHKLTQLNATVCGRISPALSPDSYLAIRNHQHHLRELNLSGNRCCLEGIQVLFSCASLKVLYCGACDGLTAELLNGFLHIPSLETLELEDCTTFDCVIPEYLAPHANKLRKLTLQQFTEITDLGLVSILQRCTIAQYLCFSGARLLTLGAVDIVAASSCSTSLCGVKFTACRNLNQSSVKNRLEKLGTTLSMTGTAYR